MASSCATTTSVDTSSKDTEKEAASKNQSETTSGQGIGKTEPSKPAETAAKTETTKPADTASSEKIALLEKNNENTKPAAEEKTAPVPETPKVVEKTAFELYQSKVGGLTLAALSSPKETINKKAFAAPFSVSVKDAAGAPVSGLELSVVYPTEKSDGTVVLAETAVVSDASGTASFTAQTPSFACNSVVKFYPKGDVSDAQIAKSASEHTVEIPYKVRTNLRNSGGIIAVIDYNQNGTPLLSNTLSSSNLLTSLMRLGFTGIGNSNSTINNAVVKGDKNAVYRETKNLVGSHSSFVIYGTIKYNADATGLIGEATALSLSDGSVLCRASKTASLSGSNLATARKEIADYFASVFNYGL